MNEYFVSIEGVSKTFGAASPALDQITAAIKGGAGVWGRAARVAVAAVRVRTNGSVTPPCEAS